VRDRLTMPSDDDQSGQMPLLPNVSAVEVVQGKFGITEAVMAGDRGMITSARIKALKEIPGMAWITCLRAPAIKKLAEDGGPLQMSLFDTQDLAEISSPDYPGEWKWAG
jgi:hypothetical protein